MTSVFRSCSPAKLLSSAALLTLGISASALAGQCQAHYRVKSAFFRGETFSTWANEPLRARQLYTGLYHQIWAERWQQQVGNAQTLEISAINAASLPGEPQRLLVTVGRVSGGSQVHISFHIPPLASASAAVTEQEMCSLLSSSVAFIQPAVRGSGLESASATPGQAPQAPSGEAPLYDVTKFAIAGVKLGMSYPQALAALENFLHVTKSAVHFDFKPSIAPGVPSSLDVKVPHGQYTVNFAHRLPVSRSNPAVVEGVYYSLMPDTPENHNALLNAAVKRYGPPSNSSIGHEWCANLQAASCRTKEPVLWCCRGPAPHALSALNLALEDPGYLFAWNRHLEKISSSKPSF